MDKTTTSRIARRLVPLYIAAFFHGFVLWYAIEKLFMHNIGFDDAGIGLMVAAYSTLTLLLETPSGVLADRWSRKGVLMVASIFLGASALVCGISTEPVLYIIGALVWGAFYALYSGTYDSIIYDVVKEETKSGNLFDKFFGRFRVVDSLALVTGAVAGGALGQLFDLPATYYMSIPLAFGALIALRYFKEPQLHKEGRHDNVKAHIAETFQLVLGRVSLLPLVLLLTTLYLIMEILYEFSQLWFIAVQAPPALLGPAFAVVLASSGVGGYLVDVFRYRSRGLMLGIYAAVVVASLGLVFVQELVGITLLQFAVLTAVVGISILAKNELHDALPSRVRAGASSAISTLSRIVLIPASLIFGVISTQASVFSAAWIVCGLAALCLVLEIVRPKKLHDAVL